MSLNNRTMLPQSNSPGWFGLAHISLQNRSRVIELNPGLLKCGLTRKIPVQ
jgi:hypothetical protein